MDGNLTKAREERTGSSKNKQLFSYWTKYNKGEKYGIGGRCSNLVNMAPIFMVCI